MTKKIVQIESIEAKELFAKIDQLQEQIKELQRETINKTLAEKFLTRKDIAKLFGISNPTIQDWSRKGILKAYKVANRVYFKADEIEQVLISISNPGNLN